MQHFQKRLHRQQHSVMQFNILKVREDISKDLIPTYDLPMEKNSVGHYRQINQVCPLPRLTITLNSNIQETLFLQNEYCLHNIPTTILVD